MNPILKFIEDNGQLFENSNLVYEYTNHYDDEKYFYNDSLIQQMNFIDNYELSLLYSNNKKNVDENLTSNSYELINYNNKKSLNIKSYKNFTKPIKIKPTNSSIAHNSFKDIKFLKQHLKGSSISLLTTSGQIINGEEVFKNSSDSILPLKKESTIIFINPDCIDAFI